MVERASYHGGEFVRPTHAEWIQEYQTVPWDSEQYTSGFVHPTVIYSYLLPMLEVLSLPSVRDYNQPERAALVLETIHLLPPEARHGGIALATWMIKVGQNHLPTRVMGAAIIASAITLPDYLNLPQETAAYIETTLKEQGITDFQGYTGAADIIRRKTAEVSDEIPLQTWLINKAQAVKKESPLINPTG